MRKPKDWGQPCPNPACSHYRLMHRGNGSALSTYMTQSGQLRICCWSKCARPFSETRDTVSVSYTHLTLPTNREV